jgi:hypothetical protein
VTLGIYAHLLEGDLYRLFDGMDAAPPPSDVAQV